jgi:type IV pilus assembly protein PilW
MHNSFNKRLRAVRGMTLIELMVSMVIGIFLVLGAVTVYSQGRQNYTANEGIARLQENLRFAVNVLEPDVRLSGYWGMHNDSGLLEAPGIAITCDGNDVTPWALNMGAGGPPGMVAINNVQAGNNGFVTPGCPATQGGIVIDTDVLEIRRASAQPAPLSPGDMQLQSRLGQATVFQNGVVPAAYAGLAPGLTNTYSMLVNSWYVANGSNADPTVPSLRRRTLRGGQMVDEEVIAGVENMQIQLGLDTTVPPDGNVDQYVDPDDPAVALSEVVAARLWLLIRTTDAERGFVDGATYTPLDRQLANIQPGDNFRRMQVAKTIFLRNFRG